MTPATLRELAERLERMLERVQPDLIQAALEARQDATDEAAKLLDDGFPERGNLILEALSDLDRIVVRLSYIADAVPILIQSLRRLAALEQAMEELELNTIMPAAIKERAAEIEKGNGK